MRTARDGIVLFIAQGGYSGRIPFAPGTMGTGVAVLFYLLLKGLAPAVYIGVCLFVVVIGTWAADRAEKLLGTKDSPSIVIDEIAGFLLSMFLVPARWEYVTAAFFLFRLFDILKPWPLHGWQKIKGGVGVMIDDLGAGIYTNGVLQVAMFMLARFS